MKSILTVVGARPQFIKASVVSAELKRLGIPEKMIHTGQHYDSNMSDLFFEELEIPKPAFNLGIGSGSHGAQTAKMLAGIEEIILAEKPSWVLVYGDTNSTLAGALAAAKLHVPIAHVEAGLRSFNKKMPEEINRVLTDHCSDLLFAPTDDAVKNLKNEGVPAVKVKLVGDVMFDVARHFGQRAEERSRILERLELRPGSYILSTVHRAENTDVTARMQAIFEALAEVASGKTVVLPMHPRTRAILRQTDSLRKPLEKLKVIDPVGYLDMLKLEKNAALIATDSGGVQKEAFFYRVPCVTMRDETEWVELVESGWNRLASPGQGAQSLRARIVAALGSQGREIQPYGDGSAANKICQSLMSV